MKIAIIGASGFVGSRLVTEALERGHDVTAIARNPEKITVQNAALTTKQADVNEVEGLAELLAGHDVVISSFNAGWDSPTLYEDFLAGSKAIQEATKKAGVNRLLVVGGAGSLEAAPGVQLVDTPQFPAEWKAGATAARDYLNVLKQEEDLDWTFLSPAINLYPGERSGKYKVGSNQPIFDEEGKSNISAEDLSVALLDEVEKPAHIRQRFTIGY
ncbi:NAD(P)-dependent oxidoreductase [Tellurirhabdus bombi]|uniref:NAD(P)-dependent oxidoreductase n=1 Tax=Tellurirhabdus bombi TaxID=2907205 RepID=UPI001F2BFB19|nr:NAD(P)-dependent oxidoreductase [Tellurirhabdus bombi]